MNPSNKNQPRENTARLLQYVIIGLAGVIVFMAGVIIVLARNNAHLQAEDDFINLEVARSATLQAGNVIVPILTQTPGIFEPTLTAIALLNMHDPSLPENNRVDAFGIAMVRVPAGCFFMGSDQGYDADDKPAHQVCFAESFWIDKYEVSQADFARSGGQKANPNAFIGDRLPVEQITWFEARDFCMLRVARLPTEAEWEYAARGPDGLVYPWGNIFVADNVAYSENTRQTTPVGNHPGGVSWVGALDMSGNVWEWTNSLHGHYPYRADDGRENPDNVSDIRVMRGGSWSDFSNDSLRASARYSWSPISWNDNFGFRCAASS